MDDRTAALAKVEKLLALCESDNDNEARTAAIMACRLITGHDLLHRPEDHVEAITVTATRLIVQHVARHRTHVVGITTALQKAQIKLGVELPPKLARRAYHRARVRLEALLRRQLLERDLGQGYAIRRGVKLRDFPEYLQ
jgi:hypothetical protein